MRVTRFLVVLVVAVFTGNHVYATAGSVFKSGDQSRDDISSALNKILAQALKQVIIESDQDTNGETIAHDSARVWQLSIRKAGLENMVDRYAANGDGIRQNREVYLDTGDAKSGLEHIWLRHGQEFNKLATTDVKNQQQLQQFIYKLMSIGQYSGYAFKRIPEERGGGFQVIYEVDGGVYMSVIIAKNGYIVTATIANDNTKKRLYNGPQFASLP